MGYIVKLHKTKNIAFTYIKIKVLTSITNFERENIC